MQMVTAVWSASTGAIRPMSGLTGVLAGLAVYETARISLVQLAEARVAECATLPAA